MGEDTCKVTGHDDIRAEPETILNCRDRTLAIGSVCEVVVIPDRDPAPKIFAAKFGYGDANETSKANTVEFDKRHCHIGVAAENACAKESLCRSRERSCVSGACLTSNTADTINHATSEPG